MDVSFYVSHIGNEHSKRHTCYNLKLNINITDFYFMARTNFRGSKTEHNVMASFAGECQARGRYTLFAEQAEAEGYMQIAEIFRETADQELSHAKQFFSVLEGGMVEIKAAYPAGVVSDTLTNLREAAAGEREEWSALYADFAQTAEDEGFKDIAIMFKNIAKVEIVHEERYLRLAERVQTGTVFTSEDEAIDWQCRQCGYVHHGKSAPKKCPVCGKPQGYYERKAENY